MEIIQLPVTSDQRRICSRALGSSVSVLVGYLVNMAEVRVSSFLEEKAMDKSLGIKESKACPESSWIREGGSIEAMNSSLIKGTRGGNRVRQRMRMNLRVKCRMEVIGAEAKESGVMGLRGASCNGRGKPGCKTRVWETERKIWRGVVSRQKESKEKSTQRRPIKELRVVLKPMC